jgi:hypothetical protein
MKRSAGKHTIYLTVGVWYNEEARDIRLSFKGASEKGVPMRPTTVSSDPTSKRGHPHLFRKLALCLKQAEMPHPPIEDDDE